MLGISYHARVLEEPAISVQTSKGVAFVTKVLKIQEEEQEKESEEPLTWQQCNRNGGSMQRVFNNNNLYQKK